MDISKTNYQTNDVKEASLAIKKLCELAKTKALHAKNIMLKPTQYDSYNLEFDQKLVISFTKSFHPYKLFLPKIFLTHNVKKNPDAYLEPCHTSKMER